MLTHTHIHTHAHTARTQTQLLSRSRALRKKKPNRQDANSGAALQTIPSPAGRCGGGVGGQTAPCDDHVGVEHVAAVGGGGAHNVRAPVTVLWSNKGGRRREGCL